MIEVTKNSDLSHLKRTEAKGSKRKVKRDIEESDENMRLLNNAEQCWEALASFREKRRRTRNYRMGEQWNDIITDPDTGEKITEEELIMRNGKVPLKQNIIGQMANSFLGQYRSNPSKSIVVSRVRNRQKESEMMSVALEGILQANMAESLDADRVNEFITSGLPFQKLTWKYIKERDRKDIFLKNVSVNNVFFNTDISDIRGNDLVLIGERIECHIDDIVSTFAKTKDREAEIREIYEAQFNKDIYAPNELGRVRYDNASFLFASDDDKVVMFEIWYLEGQWMLEVHDWADGTVTVTSKTEKELQQQNEIRIQVGLEQGIPEEEIPIIEWEPIFEQVWKVKYLTPWGHSLQEMDTPYLHDEHPYVMHAYPLIDGEIWGFLSEFIDQQRYINRLITLWDFIISSSSKGLLMIPENMIPDTTSPEEFASEYKRHNGIVIYKPQNQTQKPEWLTQNSTNVGIQDMLSLQFKLINDISGIQGAMQGQAPTAGTPASMYAMQTQNSSINVLDKMKNIDMFIEKRNKKILKLIKQFYDEPRFINITGSAFDDEAKWFDPARIKDLDFDLSVVKGKDAPAYRMMMDDLLLQLLQGQFIDIEMYLENSSAVFSDKILEQIKMKKEQMMQGGLTPEVLQNMPPELMQQIQGANPQFLNAIGAK